MSLLSLPAELKIAIANQTEPKECFGLALTCRELHTCLEDTLATHRRLSERYNAIIATDPLRCVGNAGKEVLLNRRLRTYVEKICLAECKCIYRHDCEHTKLRNPGLFATDVLSAFCEALDTMHEALPDFHFANVDNRRGDLTDIEDIIAAVCPNLRSLKVTKQLCDEDDILLYLMGQNAIVRGILKRAMGHTPFQSLKYLEVNLCRDWDEGCISPDWAKVALDIPSLESFVSSTMGGGYRNAGLGNRTAEFRHSNIRKLVFRHSFIPPEVMEDILKDTQGLRSFASYNGGALVAMDGGYCPKRVTAGLLKYAGHSLEHLMIDAEDMEDEAEIPSISLRKFKCLKTLRCSVFVLENMPPEEHALKVRHGAGWEKYATPETSDQSRLNGHIEADGSVTSSRWSFADRLPKSLEGVHLAHLRAGGEDLFQELLDFIQNFEIWCPDLKRVYVERLSSTQEDALIQQIEAKGLKFGELPNLLWRCEEDF